MLISRQRNDTSTYSYGQLCMHRKQTSGERHRKLDSYACAKVSLLCHILASRFQHFIVHHVKIIYTRRRQLYTLHIFSVHYKRHSKPLFNRMQLYSSKQILTNMLNIPSIEIPLQGMALHIEMTVLHCI